MLETAGKSLNHSCRSELTRQGISLPLDRYGYGRRLLKIQDTISMNSIIYPCSTGQASDSIQHFSISQSPVFLINSRYPHIQCYLFSKNKFFLSLSYKANLPSSFSIFILNISVFSTYLPFKGFSTVLFFH